MPQRGLTRGGGAFFLTGFATDCSSHPWQVRGRSQTAASIAGNPCVHGETDGDDKQGDRLWDSSCIIFCRSARHTCQTVSMSTTRHKRRGRWERQNRKGVFHKRTAKNFYVERSTRSQPNLFGGQACNSPVDHLRQRVRGAGSRDDDRWRRLHNVNGVCVSTKMGQRASFD